MCEEISDSMESKLLDLNILHTVQENRGLLALNRTIASPEQHRDLVEIGNQYFETYVKYYILRDPYPKESDVCKHLMLRKRNQQRSN